MSEAGSSLDRSEARFAGLDGLRAFAVLLVVLYHQDLIAFGWIGVELFFVLSGFLITHLLWKARSAPFGSYLIEFYGRRALRIFPLYYGVIALLALLASRGLLGPGIVRSLPWLATYTYNFWIASSEFRPALTVGHLWSLAVEEQFYLLWPLVVYACSRVGLRRLLIALVLLGPLLRVLEVLLLRSAWLPANPDTTQAVYVLTPTYFDAFAAGGYIALFPRGGSRRSLLVAFALTVTALVWVLRASPTLRGESAFGPGGSLIWGFSLLNITAALALDCLISRKLAPWLFDARPVRYLGTISYGLYVFHVPVQFVVDRRLHGASVWLRLGLELVLTVLIAATSYHLYERRFLRLKERWFPSRAADETAHINTS